MSESLTVNEIFLSIQGEGGRAGWPCIFVRLTGCPLRCSYCDTSYAFTEGRRMLLGEIEEAVDRLGQRFLRRPGREPWPYVEVTGGEPLAQPASLSLLRRLCDAGYGVILETSGAYDIVKVDPRVSRVLDLKCPSSGEHSRNRWSNLPHLKPTDELKFVIATEEDYLWARRQLEVHSLIERCPVLFSWATPLPSEQRDPSLKPLPSGSKAISQQALVERMLADALPVRYQAQLHKLVWPTRARGV